MNNKKMLTYEEINIGDSAEFKVLITEDMHVAFASLSGDFSPIHTSNEFAQKNHFNKKIGYAYLLTSFLSRLYGEYLPAGNSICIKQDAKFPKPYYIGDTITVKSTVIEKIDSTKFIDIETKMYTNNEDCVFRGIGTVKILS